MEASLENISDDCKLTRFSHFLLNYNESFSLYFCWFAVTETHLSTSSSAYNS